jgi:predicted nucleic acid-binding protein
MTATLIDSNVLIDLTGPRSRWSEWSAAAVKAAARRGPLVINPLIYAEVSIAFQQPEELDAALPVLVFRREELPWSAAFLAGKAFLTYRRRDGARTSPLPDFYIGAHAVVAGYRLLTRDKGRYETYFPSVKLIVPDQDPG